MLSLYLPFPNILPLLLAVPLFGILLLGVFGRISKKLADSADKPESMSFRKCQKKSIYKSILYGVFVYFIRTDG